MSISKIGIVQVQSEHSFGDTFERLKSTVVSRGLTIFANINFSADADRANLKMNPTQLLIFGNPKAGTPIIIAAPTVALDFPLKVLVSEDSNGKVWISYNLPLYLEERHGIPDWLMKNIAGIVEIAESAAK